MISEPWSQEDALVEIDRVRRQYRFRNMRSFEDVLRIDTPVDAVTLRVLVARRANGTIGTIALFDVTNETGLSGWLEPFFDATAIEAIRAAEASNRTISFTPAADRIFARVVPERKFKSTIQYRNEKLKELEALRRRGVVPAAPRRSRIK